VKTNLTARNLELTDLLRGQIEKKLRRLDRITHDMAEADVEPLALTELLQQVMGREFIQKPMQALPLITAIKK
jgi:hypothetical protein